MVYQSFHMSEFAMGCLGTVSNIYGDGLSKTLLLLLVPLK